MTGKKLIYTCDIARLLLCKAALFLANFVGLFVNVDKKELYTFPVSFKNIQLFL